MVPLARRPLAVAPSASGARPQQTAVLRGENEGRPRVLELIANLAEHNVSLLGEPTSQPAPTERYALTCLKACRCWWPALRLPCSATLTALTPRVPPTPYRLQAVVQRFETFAGRGAMVGLVVAATFELLLPLAAPDAPTAGLFGGWDRTSEFVGLTALLCSLAAVLAVVRTQRWQASRKLLEPVITSLTSKQRRCGPRGRARWGK